VGLRAQHYQTILETFPELPWFEALTDNYCSSGGMDLVRLMQVREHYPIVLHGVGLSIGSTDPLNKEYLSKLKSLCQRVQPAYVSDHLCWIGVENHYLHELMPLPYTEEALAHVADRVKQVQDYLGRQIMLENASSYLSYQHSTMFEAEFLAALAEKADCWILLDVNNVYVSSYNHGFDAKTYFDYLPKARIKQMHLAGYSDEKTQLLDTHGKPVQTPVWALYEESLKKFGPVPGLIEWDNDIPEFDVLLKEAQHAAKIMENVCGIIA
jgi:uncharacterized protein